jgi:hypothetical protein
MRERLSVSGAAWVPFGAIEASICACDGTDKRNVRKSEAINTAKSDFIESYLAFQMRLH